MPAPKVRTCDCLRRHRASCNAPPFLSAICHPDRRKWSADGLCSSCSAARYARAKPEQRRLRKRRWESANPDKVRRTKRRGQLKRQYGLTEAVFGALVAAHDGACAICRGASALCVDHDHQTLLIRGLLCRVCNKALGLLDDDVDRIGILVSYAETADTGLVAVPKLNTRGCGRDPHARRLWFHYGLTPADYDGILNRQGGLCAVCRDTCPTGQRLGVDHDHQTMRVRGLLCKRCNLAIGCFGDDTPRLARAGRYLLGLGTRCDRCNAGCSPFTSRCPCTPTPFPGVQVNPQTTILVESANEAVGSQPSALD